MKLNKTMIRGWVPNADYNRGRQYFAEGLVRQFSAHVTEEVVSAHCVVEGNQTYDVSLRIAYSALVAQCTCPRYADTGSCKHIAAALLYLEQKMKDEELEKTTDQSAFRVMELYRRKVERPTLSYTGTARLVPSVELGTGLHYPDLSFQVGYDRLYVVKDVKEFLGWVDNGEEIVYGKHLTLNHALSEFTPWSQQLIRLLMEQHRRYRSLSARQSSYYSYYNRYSQRSSSNSRTVRLDGKAFDRFFALMQERPEEEAPKKGNLLFGDGDPEYRASFQRSTNSAVLRLKSRGDWRFFGYNDQLYAADERAILRCSDDFRERVYPMLQVGSREMRFALSDLSTFCSVVLPDLQGMVELSDPDGLLEQYLPDEMTPRFYLDLNEDDELEARLCFLYGETELTDNASEHPSTVRRDPRAEQQARNLLLRWFRERPELHHYFLFGEEQIFDFLTEELPKLQEAGEVFLSDRLKNRQLRPSKATVGISVSEGMLSLEFDTGEFPAEELEALYSSLLRRKRYHKLKNGQFLPLNGSAVEKLAEAVHMTQLSATDLKNGNVTLPLYRGLYLDSVLNGQEGVEVNRDQRFRSMVRSFKTVSESDYQVPDGLRGVLRPYQKTGFRWLKTLESSGFGGILADEMGLGKTIQVIAFLSTVRRETGKKPSLIVCPASLILNWGDEFARFAPEVAVTLVMGTVRERKDLLTQGLETSDVLVTSYDLLKRDISRFREQEFYCVVLDEGQFVKNQSTLASKAVKSIPCAQRFVLTGTPIENRLSELWNLYDFLMPGYLFTHNRFVEKLEKPIVKSGDEEAREQLRRLVRPFLLRRLKADVLKELPPKVEHIRRVRMEDEERKTYAASVIAARDGLGAEGSKLQILAALTRLRQICCDAGLCFENYTGGTSKLDACVELCCGMAENGHQILLFSQFTSMLERIRQRLEAASLTCFTLQGSTPKEQRARLVKDFNAGKAQVFLISLKAGGTGLNLTAADVVIHYDPWWNLAAQNQATDRAHRIGQRESVQVYKLIVKDSIEEKILDLQEKKAELMNAVADASEESILTMSKEDLMGLLE